LRLVSTAAASSSTADRRTAWRTRGVETVALDDIDAFLLTRRFHFAAIVVAPAFRARLTTVLADTQPQATVADLPSGDEPTMDPSALEAWIGSLDLVPTLPPQ
jgi:hypothetical protein